MTASMPLPATAHDCFLIANDLYRRGHYLDAQTLFDRACRLEPNNAEYAAARERLHTLAFSFFKKGGASSKGAANSAECWGNCCECGGECCAEGCAEGCGEICEHCCCEGCAEGCGSCDCS